jgi:methylthioribose-1-phosphate isomerase
VGADRIAANGDTANKIGTYSVSVLARHHGIPSMWSRRYPPSTWPRRTGRTSPSSSATRARSTAASPGQRPPGVKVYNPAFDVTPHENIAGIVTEHGVIDASDAPRIREHFIRNGLLADKG